MITVQVKNGELDKALRKFKQRVAKSGLPSEVKKKKEYTKPGVVKREARKEAQRKAGKAARRERNAAQQLKRNPHKGFLFFIKLIGDTMNIRKIVDDYIECNSFEIKIKDKKAWFYYYDTVKNFSNTNIEIIKDNNVYKVKGKKLFI